MEFEKINYEELKLKPEDKVSSEVIHSKNIDNSTSEVKISGKEVKKSVKALSNQCKSKKEDEMER